MNSRDFLLDPIWLADSQKGIVDYEQSLPVLLKMLTILDHHQISINRTPEIDLGSWKLKLCLLDSDVTIQVDIFINNEEITLHQYGGGFLGIESRFVDYSKKPDTSSKPRQHYHVVEELNDDVLQQVWQDIKRLLKNY